ncbi:MAG: asparagine synthase (glutamine-hydrolyzing) [Acidobacteriota bacterium]
MCGICGIYDPQGRLSALTEMNSRLRHRGPDDEGYLFAEAESGRYREAGGPDTRPELRLPDCAAVLSGSQDLALASRRLAILDLSPAGHMPMPTGRGRLWLIHNGEVYNYRELRKELKTLGHTFRTGSDTEVILAAYAEWGTDCLARFNGMFAFALWDVSRRLLFCARDRFGIKPFYYWWRNSTFVFASEIKALLCHPAVQSAPDDEAVFDYLALGLSDHGERTFFAGISSLSPGHFLVFDTRRRALTLSRWWKGKASPEIFLPGEKARANACDEFRELLADAVRLRLRSDVPVGSCLSGGLDSSTLVYLTNRVLKDEHQVHEHLVGKHQKTFTARNAEPEIDEYRFSRLIAGQTGAEQHLVLPTGPELWREIDQFVWHMDEPVDSTSQYPQWNVMRLARREGVTVLLDGQGGDELLAGYHSYYPLFVSQMYQSRGLIPALRSAFEVSRIGGTPVRQALWQKVFHSLPWRAQQLIGRVNPPQPVRGIRGSGLKSWQLRAGLSQKFWERRWQPQTITPDCTLADVLYRDLTVSNLPKLLRYEDRNSMAFSIETRLPFLDYRLVERVLALPLGYRIHGGWSKWILRQAMDRRLPAEICWRRTKLGFPTPEGKWIQEGAGYIRRLVKEAPSEVDQYLNLPALRSAFSEISDEAVGTVPGAWRIANLITWFNVFFPRTAAAVRDHGVETNARAERAYSHILGPPR